MARIETKMRDYRAGRLTRAEVAEFLAANACRILRDDAVCFLAYDYRTQTTLWAA